MTHHEQPHHDRAAPLVALGELALTRHAAQHAAQPRRAAASYLRVALTCARELARHAKRQPPLRDAALRLLARIISVAHAAEADCFAAGGNSAAYIRVLVTAEGLRLTLADAPPAAPAASPTIAALPPSPAAILAHRLHLHSQNERPPQHHSKKIPSLARTG